MRKGKSYIWGNINRSYSSIASLKPQSIATHLDHEVAVILRSHHDNGVMQLFVEVNM